MLSSTYYKQQSVHPQEESHMQFYGICSCIRMSSLVGVRMYVYQTHPDIDQTAYTDAWTNTAKLHIQVFLMMNSWSSKHVENNII